MPEIRRGAVLVSRLPRVAAEVSEVRRGSTLIWNKDGVLRDDFNRATLGSTWTDVSAFGTAYPLGIEDNNRVRMLVPDGLTLLTLQIAHARYNVAQLPGDDGFIEVRPMSIGDLLYTSAAWARASTTGNFTNGVGLYMSAGHLWIASRLLSIDAIVADCGTFQAGDVLRMTFANRHFEVFRNGTQVGEWDDGFSLTGKGSGFRSMVMRGDGAKDLIDFGTFSAGPRRFGPSLDYVMMGNLT